ncbi:SecDF P1 head subdomain-containing protein [Cumulibacter soli]|uniref:SecDF P1 head subdomain-containing protein n=1 Tax=Cumulibacter soli TaxID=2546344 RepID=UPI0010689935|nr:hypothetical protein [Cumulibacter soli]
MTVRRLVPVSMLACALVLGACADDSDSSTTPDDTSPASDGQITSKEPLTIHPVADQAAGECPAVDEPQLALPDPTSEDCLILDEPAMAPTQFEGVEATLDPNLGAWVVNLTLIDADSETFGELTAQTAQLDPPQNRIALVLDGSELLVAPVVADRIVGPVQISGGFSETDAKDIAEALGG